MGCGVASTTMMDGISCRVGYCGFGQPRSGLVRSINAWNFLISDGTLTESCAPFTTDWDSEVRSGPTHEYPAVQKEYPGP